MYFSIRWELVRSRRNVNEIRVTFLDEKGECRTETKYYENWIGVCTNHIDRVVSAIQEHFPGHKVLSVPMGRSKKILPYFKDRLARGKLNNSSKPFYKVYTSASHENVGHFFRRYKISYFDRADWLVRIYIDLCTLYDTHAFYYRWYELQENEPNLLDALRMVPHRTEHPDWKVAAFDLETVPMVGNHVPQGYDPSDRIVMISVYKWSRQHPARHWLLYLLPDAMMKPLLGYEEAFRNEADMLERFHALLDDAQVITGYNINSFDFPCLFARLTLLKQHKILKRYSSANVGTDVVTTFDAKLVVDLYPFFKTFSGYNLPSFKLDDVARIKLEGETKLPVKSTGIWHWYRNPPSQDLLESEDAEHCFETLRPQGIRLPEFGTYRTYLDYCLKDSELVYRLFEKENVLSFLVERANFAALNAVEALHFGNSRYLLELFKTYGARLGYFFNQRFFSAERESKVGSSRRTYQGALNYCVPQRVYENVSVMDFNSMYPSSLLSTNLCYGTCAFLTREEWLDQPAAQTLMTIPFREHSDNDFETPQPRAAEFRYPTFDPQRDAFALVVHTEAEAFLPRFVSHFIEMRREHQRAFRETGDVYHYNVQLGIKILINSLYGVMANKDSPLAYLDIAIAIVTLSRYQLLGSYHYIRNAGYGVCYADTDSLMVHRWPLDNCDAVNTFLNLRHVELKFEQRMKRLLVLSKKRYVYETDDGTIVTKGFQKKVNGLVEFMTNQILSRVWRDLFDSNDEALSPGTGWVTWVETLSQANYMCRDPKKYSIYRKIKNLNEYKSASCPSVKYLRKYPDRNDEHVEFTYGRADVAASEASNWVMDVDDCRWVNFEQLFMSQKKIFCMLLNLAYWHLPDPTIAADMILNTIHWKRFVHAELLHRKSSGNCICLLVEPTLKYTFTINNHSNKKRCPGRKRKVEI